MRLSQKIIAFLLMAAVSLCLVSCGEENPASSQTPGSSTESQVFSETETPSTEAVFEPAVTGIYINREGRVFSAEVTSFDNSGFSETRYDEASLWNFVDGEIMAFNSAKGIENAVALEKLEVADKKATLVLSYDSIASFLDFQGNDFGVTDIRITTVGAMISAGEDMPGLKRMDGEIASVAEATMYPEAQVIFVTGHCLLSVEGEMYCYDEFAVLENASSIMINSNKPVCVLVR